MPPFSTDAEKWRAVQNRDAAADGVFVYAVRTTRIYCRPNCKARLARRANVAFYPAAPAAEAAGFRACKRCKPKTEGGLPEDEAVVKIRALVAGVEGTAGDTPGACPAGLASQVGVSKWHFHRTFKAVTGQTPRAYLKRQRRAREEKAAPSPSNDSPSTLTTLTPSTESPYLFSLFDLTTEDVLPPADGTAPPDMLFEVDTALAGLSDFDTYLAGLDPAFVDPALWDMGMGMDIDRDMAAAGVLFDDSSLCPAGDVAVQADPTRVPRQRDALSP